MLKKTSFFRQTDVLKNILDVYTLNIPKREANNILFNKFKSDNQELVASVKEVMGNCEDLQLCRHILRDLLWVDFNIPICIVLDDN